MTYTAASLRGLNAEQRQGIIAGRARQVLAALPGTQRALPAARELEGLLHG